ncbi:hypothetical protein GLOTRDRAFT_109757, partial [Gloeophyllum trabeum ATCC 11539]
AAYKRCALLTRFLTLSSATVISSGLWTLVSSSQVVSGLVYSLQQVVKGAAISTTAWLRVGRSRRASRTPPCPASSTLSSTSCQGSSPGAEIRHRASHYLEESSLPRPSSQWHLLL